MASVSASAVTVESSIPDSWGDDDDVDVDADDHRNISDVNLDDDSVFSSGPPKAMTKKSRPQSQPLPKAAASTTFAVSARSSRPDSLPDEDYSVTTLQTRQTFRTNRTGKTGATFVTNATAKQREIDALFEDLLTDGADGNQQQVARGEADTQGDLSTAVSSFATLPKHMQSPSRASGAKKGLAKLDERGDDDDGGSKAAKARRAGLDRYDADGAMPEPTAPPEIYVSGEGNGAGAGASISPSTAANSRLYRARASSRPRARRANANASVAESTLGTNGVSSILDSLGLGGPGPARRGGAGRHSSNHSKFRSDYSEYDAKSKKSAGGLDGFLSSNREDADGGADQVEESKHDKKLRRRREERQVHLRAGTAILGLVGLVFAAVQLTSSVRTNRALLRRMRGGHRRYDRHPSQVQKVAEEGGGEAFEEGVDRPVHGDIPGLKHGHHGGGHHPPEMALKLVRGKVPREGPSDSLRKFRNYDEGSDGEVEGGEKYEDPKDNEAAAEDFNDVLAAEEKREKKEPQPKRDVLPPGAATGGGGVDAPPAAAQADGAAAVVEALAAEGEGEKRASQADLDALLKSSLPPSFFTNLSPNTSPDPNRHDVPLFWHVPRSGGSIVRKILEECRESVLASEAGASEGHGEDKELAVVTLGDGRRVVNVDASTASGLERAKTLGLGSSTLEDLSNEGAEKEYRHDFAIVTPQLHAAVDVFDGSSRKVRAFALLRHPVERAVSTYYNLKKAGHPDVSKMSLEEYAKSSYAENNWMVRFLSGKMDGDVTTDHLAVANEVLRTKFVVGLLRNKDGSMERFEHYFGWTYETQDGWDCRKKILDGTPSTNESSKYFVKEGNQAWNLLLWQNKYDAKLYEYAHYLFGRQGEELFPDLDHNKNK